jgi:hypothetical protein
LVFQAKKKKNGKQKKKFIVSTKVKRRKKKESIHVNEYSEEQRVSGNSLDWKRKKN